jgi:hypothetical protein
MKGKNISPHRQILWTRPTRRKTVGLICICVAIRNSAGDGGREGGGIVGTSTAARIHRHRAGGGRSQISGERFRGAREGIRKGVSPASEGRPRTTPPWLRTPRRRRRASDPRGGRAGDLAGCAAGSRARRGRGERISGGGVEGCGGLPKGEASRRVA